MVEVPQIMPRTYHGSLLCLSLAGEMFESYRTCCSVIWQPGILTWIFLFYARYKEDRQIKAICSFLCRTSFALEAVKAFEKQYIADALAPESAEAQYRALKCWHPRSTLFRKIKDYQLYNEEEK